MIPLWESPDCRQGKHRACSGDAWDSDLDAPTDCGCDCHDFPIPAD